MHATTIAAYQEWERRAGPGMRSRYADFAPREPIFEVRPEDVAITLSDCRIQQTGADLVTVSGRDGQSVIIRGLPAGDLTAALSLLDGSAAVARLAETASPRWPLPVWCSLLRALLGTAVDLPAEFRALSTTVARTEIVRFPEQPTHAVWRNYWENAAAVRHRLPELYRSLEDASDFRATLARLHVLATTGEGGGSYYGGYGLISTVPGGFREIGVQTAIPDTLTRTLDHWSGLLGTGPIERAGELTTHRGQVMNEIRDGGTIVVHPATDATLFALLDEIRVALSVARRAGAANKVPDALDNLANFHQLFVNAHPFANINHSIAMNIVNACLREWGLGHLPHLLLDYLAQRLPPGRFAQAFAAAVKQHALRKDDDAIRIRSLTASTALYWRYRADRDAKVMPS